MIETTLNNKIFQSAGYKLCPLPLQFTAGTTEAHGVPSFLLPKIPGSLL